MSKINPNELTELRTLGEIINFVSNQGGVIAAPTKVTAPPPNEIVRPTTEIAPPIVTTVTSSVSEIEVEQLANILLEVVSEKAGYPAELLELSMDMETDLGIDSAKRSDILEPLSQKYSELLDINLNALTELRTLGEIVDCLTNHSSKKSMA